MTTRRAFDEPDRDPHGHGNRRIARSGGADVHGEAVEEWPPDRKSVVDRSLVPVQLAAGLYRGGGGGDASAHGVARRHGLGLWLRDTDGRAPEHSKRVVHGHHDRDRHRLWHPLHRALPAAAP